MTSGSAWNWNWNWFSFMDLPEDALLSILSFLSPAEMGALACTSKLLWLWLSQNQNKVWFFMCDRRWGSKTEIKRWGCAETCYKKLYSSLSKCEQLIGFWPRIVPALDMPQVMVVEWGPSFVTGHRVIPLRDGMHRVRKVAFLWLGVDEGGELVSCGQLGFPKEELGEVRLSVRGEERNYVLEIESCGDASRMSLGARARARARAGAGAEFGEIDDAIELVYGAVPEDGFDDGIDEQYFALADALSKYANWFFGDPPGCKCKNPVRTKRELFRSIAKRDWLATPPPKRATPRDLLIFPRIRMRHQTSSSSSSS